MLEIAELVRAVAAFVADPTRVKKEQFSERLEACQACEHRRGSKCGLCGCWIKIKARGKAFMCPDNPPRWPLLTEGLGATGDEQPVDPNQSGNDNQQQP